MRNVVILVSLLLISCGSVSHSPKKQASPENSVVLQSSQKEIFSKTLEVLREINFEILEKDNRDHAYILASTKKSKWMYLLSVYGNYGSYVGIYLKKTNIGTVVWIESEAKFKFIGSLFEPVWEPDILNRLSVKDVEVRSEIANKNLNDSKNKIGSSILNTYLLIQNKCLEINEWTRSDNREQGGGWLWFTGKGVGTNLRDTYKTAEGMALHRMSLECGAPHINTRLIERCDDNSNELNYVAYVRVNIKELDCITLKNSHEKEKEQLTSSMLMKILDEYNGN